MSFKFLFVFASITSLSLAAGRLHRLEFDLSDAREFTPRSLSTPVLGVPDGHRLEFDGFFYAENSYLYYREAYVCDLMMCFMMYMMCLWCIWCVLWCMWSYNMCLWCAWCSLWCFVWCVLWLCDVVYDVSYNLFYDVNDVFMMCFMMYMMFLWCFYVCLWCLM